MKCDACGQKLDESQAIEISCYKRHEGGGSYTMMICPSCEAKRTEAATILAWVVVVFCGLSLVAFAAIVAAIKLR